MVWPLVAAFAVQAAGNLMQGSANRTKAKAENKINEANAYAKNVTTQAKNEANATGTAFERFTQTINNQRIMKAGGDQYNAAGEQIGARLDATVRGSLERRLQAAEELGALAAQAGAMGVGGSTVDMINATTRLRNARGEAEAAIQEKGLRSTNRGNIMMAAMDSTDQRLILDSWDYSVAQSGNMPVEGNALGDLLGMSKGTTTPNFKLVPDMMKGLNI